MATVDRVLVHLTAYRRLPVDPAKVYFLEADGDETILRTRTKRVMRDVRSLGEVLPAYQRHGFLRVHRNHAVNLRRIREITRRKETDGWQLKLQPPVNLILAVGRSYLKALWKAFGS